MDAQTYRQAESRVSRLEDLVYDTVSNNTDNKKHINRNIKVLAFNVKGSPTIDALIDLGIIVNNY